VPDRSIAALVVALLVAVPSVADAHTNPLAGYRWVAPPPAVAEGNQPPLDRQADLPAEHDRLLATEIWTGDLQVVLGLPEIPLPEGRRASVSISITAVDPAGLPDLPDGTFADGNAYRIELDDAGTPIDRLEPAGRLTLTVPHPAATVLFSADGARWSVIVARPTDREVEVELARPGYFLAAADHALESGRNGPAGSKLALLLAVPVVALAGLLLLKRRVDRDVQAA
jgi:hypothetical protein